MPHAPTARRRQRRARRPRPAVLARILAKVRRQGVRCADCRRRIPTKDGHGHGHGFVWCEPCALELDARRPSALPPKEPT